MATPGTDKERLFNAAAELSDPVRRAAFLEAACGEDEALRAELEDLLRHDEGAGSFLQAPALSRRGRAPGAGDTPTDGTDPRDAPAAPVVWRDAEDEARGPSPHPTAEGPGARIGPYKLRQKIGEGGMGVVYMAEQEHPVRRKVALKIVKPGLDTAHVIARFEAERQALAMMDHPNIARVLDAGATELGRPFFVMELVNGVPITEYCDGARLTPRDRLELFLPVCRAIQHAHQKGIIHRDVKPSNVMVTLVDGRPTPKVIDFGIAKATEQRLTERTLFTQHGAVVGTFEYMSPEQAALSGADVDTRSDVYSLGVLLYELLTGSTPLGRSRLREAGYAEILRLIREEEPVKPSTRLSGSGEALPSIAATRGTEPGRLSRLVRGELDWIVMKALEKDRARRYDGAGGFARDVEKYLADEPVEACPPSRRYRLGKFARRHRAALAVAAAFAVLLLAAAIGGGYLAARATAAERLARRRLEATERAAAQARAVGQFMVESFRKPDPEQDGRDLKVVDLLGAAEARLGPQFGGTPAIRGTLLKALGETYVGLGLEDRAIGVLTRALAPLEGSLGPDHPDALQCRNSLYGAFLRAGRRAEAVSGFEALVGLYTARFGPEGPETFRVRANLATAYSDAGRLAEAIALEEETVRRTAAKRGPDDPLTLTIRCGLGEHYRRAGRTTEAIAILEEVLGLCTARFGPDHPETLLVRDNLAVAYHDAGRTAEAIPLQEKSLERRVADLGPDHIITLAARNNLADSYRQVGRAPEAIALQRETLERIRTRYGPDHPGTIAVRNNLAGAYQEAGRQGEAIDLLREVVPAASKAWGPGHPHTLKSTNRLAGLLEQAGRWAEAEALRRESLRRRRETAPPGSPELAADLAALGRNLMEQARWAEAEPRVRESLEVSGAKQPGDWVDGYARSLLGACLLERRQFAGAEPLLVSGYEGMKSREAIIPPPDRPRLAEAAARVARLYEAWGQPGKAGEWRRKLRPEGGPGGPSRR